MSIDPSEQLDLLKAFLVSDAVGDGAMVLSELDGFLAGLVVSPETIMPSEWLPVVWGWEDPRFEDEQQAQAIFSAIMAHYNDIVCALDRGEYDPIFDVLTHGRSLWEIWINGFWRAVSLRSEAWAFPGVEGVDTKARAALFSMDRLYHIASTPAGDIKSLEIDATLAEFAPDLITASVETLHAARLDAEDAFPPVGRPAARRKKTGRNEPCPCGSGKKFKKCCGVS